MVRRFVSFSIVLAVVSSWLATAIAQTSYNPDGTPSMIAPDGGVFDDSRPPGTGAIAPSSASVAAPEEPQAVVEERFDVDCDPDIEVCVDPSTQPATDDGYDPNAYQQFQSTLEPYGAWSQDPSYGQVWTPSAQIVGSDFCPYASGGQWVASADYGYTWASDWDWGWAPFHYGRWLFLSSLGWSWIPGTIWGPAWVDWRYGNGYVGWAPSPPAGVIVGPPRSLGTRNPWRFALAHELGRRNPTYVPHRVAASIYGRTSPVRNYRTVSFGSVNARIGLGPSLDIISRDVGRPIPALGLRNASPSALPRASIVARPGVSLAARPYVRSAPGVIPGVGPSPDRGAVSVPAPRMTAPPPYPLGQTYSAPPRVAPPASSYRAPASSYPAPAYSAPSYQAPAYRPPPPSYQAPAYRPPAPSYQAPAYRPPAPSYQAPAYRPPAPSYQAPAYRPPAPSYQAPIYRGPSAPSPSYSAPMYRAPAPQVAPPASRPAQQSPSFGPGSRRRF